MTEHFTQAEAVQLAREIDPDAFKYDGISAEVLTATVNLAATRAVAEYRKDAERMDWQESHPFQIRWMSRAEAGKGDWTVNGKEHANLRAAIDAARAAEKGANE